MFELSTVGGMGIYALPWNGRRWGKPIRLPSGAIVERVPGERQDESPRQWAAFVQIDAKGLVWPDSGARADTADLDAPFFGSNGPYLLSSGEIAIVYGARVECLATP